MSKKLKPFLAHSELTDCIYIIDGNDKYEVTEQCIKAMKATNRLPIWIPVSERLPEKYTYTLWCASSGYVRSDYFNGEFWVDAKKYCYEIIAWMPLPERYKEVEE